MEPSALASRVVEAAYRATLDPSAWQDVVAAISDVSPDARAFLQATDPARDLVFHVGVGKIPAEAVRSFEEYYSSRNAYESVMARAEFGIPVQPTTRELDTLIEPSEIYNDFLRPLGFGSAGTAILIRGERGAQLDLRMNYAREDRDRLDALVGQALAAAAPHLARALDLAVRSFGASFLAGVTAAIAHAPVPTLVLGARGTVLSANASGEALVADGPLFVDRRRRLRARVKRDDEAVDAAVSAAVRPGARPALLRVRDFGAIGDVVLSFVPIDPSVEEAARWLALLDEDAPVAAVHLSSDAMNSHALEAALADIFGLEAEEAALAVAVSRGRRLASFAAARGIDTYRASLILDRTMDRLGAHRTADVVRKVATLARVIAVPPLAAGGARPGRD